MLICASVDTEGPIAVEAAATLVVTGEESYVDHPPLPAPLSGSYTVLVENTYPGSMGRVPVSVAYSPISGNHAETCQSVRLFSDTSDVVINFTATFAGVDGSSGVANCTGTVERLPSSLSSQWVITNPCEGQIASGG